MNGAGDSLDDLLGTAHYRGLRSMENPRRPLDPWSQALSQSLDGSLSSSGVRVNLEGALTYGAFWRAITLISGTVAKLPFSVRRNLEPIGSEPDKKHPAYRLLRRGPNEEMTAFAFKQTLQSHALTHGNGFAYIQRRADGWPTELWPLNPDRTYPVREGKRLWYVHELQGGDSRKLPSQDVLHVKGLSFDGLEGYSLLSRARESIGSALAMQSFSAVFFRNNARPNVVLKHPGRLNSEARRNVRESWERMYAGLDNSHRAAILEEGLTLDQLSINAAEAQLIESKQFTLTDLANWTGLPPHKLGAMTNVSYGSLEQENQAFLDDAIDPWLVRWEEECDAKLLSSYQRDRETHGCCFDRFPLVRADLQQRGEYYVKAITNGWLSPDEVRHREGDNPIPGGAGRTYFFPLNVQPYGGDPDGPGGPAVAPGSTLLAVPDVRQEQDYDCGPAAVMAVCQFFGVGPSSRQAYIEALETTTRNGTRPAPVIALLSRLGLACTASAELGVADLGRFFAAGQPVLCPVTVPMPAMTGHWVVVVGTGLGQVFYHDPAAGLQMCSEETWLDRWFDRDADGVSYERYGIAVGEELLPVGPGPAEGGEGGDGGDGGGDDQQERTLAAVKGVVRSTLARMVKRVGLHARRAAKDPAKWCEWIGTLRDEHERTISEALADPLAALAVAAGPKVYNFHHDTAASALLREVADAMLEIAGRAKADTLAGMVDEWFLRAESDPAANTQAGRLIMGWGGG